MSLSANPPFNDSDTALRACAYLKPEDAPLVASEAKDNMVTLPGQLFYSTQIPSASGSSQKTKTPTPNAASASAGS